MLYNTIKFVSICLEQNIYLFFSTFFFMFIVFNNEPADAIFNKLFQTQKSLISGKSSEAL